MIASACLAFNMLFVFYQIYQYMKREENQVNLEEFWYFSFYNYCKTSFFNLVIRFLLWNFLFKINHLYESSYVIIFTISFFFRFIHLFHLFLIFLWRRYILVSFILWLICLWKYWLSRWLRFCLFLVLWLGFFTSQLFRSDI